MQECNYIKIRSQLETIQNQISEGLKLLSIESIRSQQLDQQANAILSPASEALIAVILELEFAQSTNSDSSY